MIHAKRARTADTGKSLMSMNAALLKLMLSFFLSKEANRSWETARIFCSCSKAIRLELLTYVFQQLCWPANVLSKFTGELGRRREDVLYMTGYLGNFPVPPLLKHLSFGHAFNQRIFPGDLPATLTQLTFGSDFNQKIFPGDLPANLTHLSFHFRSCFDHLIDEHVLPLGLTHLAFGPDYDWPLMEHILHPGLTHLAFGSEIVIRGQTHLAGFRNWRHKANLKSLKSSSDEEWCDGVTKRI
jgi:hypothetical protein